MNVYLSNRGKYFFGKFCVKENIFSDNKIWFKIAFLQNRPSDHPWANDKNVTPSQKKWLIEFSDFEFWRFGKDVPTDTQKISWCDTCFDRPIKLI